MKLRQKITYGLLLPGLILCLVFTSACSKEEKTDIPSKVASITVTDCIGREVFYKEFFAMDLSDELAKKILYGGGMRTPK